MELIYEWFALMAILVIAAMSPGPDFVMAIRNGLIHSRRMGVYTALGFAMGVAVHVSYCLMGIATVISQSIIVFSLIKYVGAAYLFYIGYKALRSNGMSVESYAKDTASCSDLDKGMSAIKAVRQGFITNLFNPKATLFFLSLFTQFISPETSFAVQALYGVTSVVMIFLWFCAVAVLFTQERVRNVFLKFSRWIDKICGGIFILMGVKLASTRV